MKKRIISMIMAVVLMAMTAGCTAAVKIDEYNEVKKLEDSLGKKVKEYARSGFGTEINLKDFDTAMGVEFLQPGCIGMGF
ncbi:hypothetical protein SAMN02745945_01477 [Peptoclostridium litorale DSM 5388]|uniref:Lipoprotein n=1 Tax=Peptoclostridium litorale DSM 5388 TaxID=1121324 RepID=A0A069RF57_PEPLI|nr:hypothetical protein [Peptoclostridium litorale]KDR95626.1 hypothetical protein CLIT_10c03530 [Peptoclostridium litorale DSM 5388]SIN99715.1 hypothetical protein SAMN02745945_01477 [Peptoclostridium litorale DSM 5388]